MAEFEIASNRQTQLIDVTAQVNDAIRESGVERGLCNIFVPHTTAAVIVSENWDPDVTHDLLAHLEKLVPRQAGYRHGEGNAQAHILSVMLGTSLNLPVDNGRLRLGRWQGVMLAEFDGPRRRSVVVSIMAK
ncbi:MAG TPA: secondary thiamine-phosphate synthase enzyme YjbQ [Candidatus Binataceae bacterium]